MQLRSRNPRACLLALLGLLALAFNAPGCGPGGLNSPPPTVGAHDTTLGPGDQFDVRVYGEEDMSASYTVSPDGTIDFPYIERVQVAELEPTEVADLIERELRERDVLVHPQVSVVVTEYVSKRISVVGAVRNPGNFPMSPGLTGLQAVGLAGGTTELANRDGAVVTRRVDGELRRYAVPLDQITLGTRDDFPVQAGDIIFVPGRVL